MKRPVSLVCATWLLVVAARADDKAFTPLFNGKNLDGWVAEGSKEYSDGDDKKPVWTVNKDGYLECAGKGYGFLRYDKKKYADFVFHVEYRMAPKCNSGLGIRTVPYDSLKTWETRPSVACYEIQLLDDAGKPPTKYSSGSLYRYVAPSENPVKPSPEWNTIAVECVGPRIKVTINDKKVIDVDQSMIDKKVIDVDQKTIDELKKKPLEGYVCLQNHNGKIEFRNVKICEIKAPAEK
jgi:hypothetical protein